MKKTFFILFLLMSLIVSAVQITYLGEKQILNENEKKIFQLYSKEYEVEVLVISETADNGKGSVKFRINGEISEELKNGQSYQLADGIYVLVEDIYLSVVPSRVGFSFSTSTSTQPTQSNQAEYMHSYSMTEDEKRTVTLMNREYNVEVLDISDEKHWGFYVSKFRINGEVTRGIYHENFYVLSDGTKISAFSDNGYRVTITFDISKRTEATTQIPVQNAPQTQSQSKSAYIAGISANLANYPSFFMSNGKFNADFVVGDMADGSDVVAAIDIITSIQTIGVDSSGNPTPITIGAAKLASEITSIGNMISIGRPCKNPITEKISGISDCHYNLQKGQAIIELFHMNGHTQIVVAGYEELETRIAARALANWNGLSGTKFLVTGKNLNEYTVTPIQSFVPEPTPIPSIPLPEDSDLTPPLFPKEEKTSLEFKRGWNLVSLPGKLVTFSDTSCSKKPSAFVYLTNEKKYVTIRNAAELLGEEFNTYLAEHAFWVYSYEDCEQSYIVEEYAPKIAISQGWNLLPSIDFSCKLDLQYWWNAKDQSWAREAKSSGTVVKSSSACEE